MKLRYLTTYDDKGRDSNKRLQFWNGAYWQPVDSYRESEKDICLTCGEIDCNKHFDK